MTEIPLRMAIGPRDGAATLLLEIANVRDRKSVV